MSLPSIINNKSILLSKFPGRAVFLVDSHHLTSAFSNVDLRLLRLTKPCIFFPDIQPTSIKDVMSNLPLEV